MKRRNISANYALILSVAIFSMPFIACQKNDAVVPVGTGLSGMSASTIAGVQAIGVARSSTSADSIYVVGTCARGHRTDSVAFSSLPAGVGSYLAGTYPGYIFQKAYTDKDTSGNIAGYVIIIQYNSKPVGVKFDAAGNFVAVLEQREGHDLDGRGWHNGGMFDGRDGLRRDSVALSQLPSLITSYFTANYSQDTLIHAYKNKDGSYVILSTNGGVFSTLFDASATFIKRVALPSPPGHAVLAALSTLPSALQSYLTATYPDYVLKDAFSVTVGGVTQGYIVFIDANNTKYALEFDASGKLVRSVAIR